MPPRLLHAEYMVSAHAGLESRFFSHEKPGLVVNSAHTTNQNLNASLKWHSNDPAALNQFSFEVRGQWDQHDSNRSYADISELLWRTSTESFSLDTGIATVFWGVTESRHLEDIINQRDIASDFEGETKLGQPQIHLSLFREFGVLEFYVLLGNRERIFAGPDGRSGAPLTISDDSTYESSAGKKRVDGAVRLSFSVAGLDVALSHFSGTTREPAFSLAVDVNGVELVPHYAVIDQSGLELQYITGELALKLEAISRAGQGDRFTAATGGLELTSSGIFDSAVDLSTYLEYSFDERGDRAPMGELDRDVFLGTRFAFNDVRNTSLLLAATIDRKSHEQIYKLDFNRRLTESWNLGLVGYAFEGSGRRPRTLPDILQFLAAPDPGNKAVFMDSEDYLQLTFTCHF